jgi:Ca-activated chloride channel family protein
MQLRTVVWLTLLGMAISSGIGGWLGSPTRTARAAVPAPIGEGSVAAPAVLARRGAVALEARMGHAALGPAGGETYLLFQAEAGGTRSETSSLHAVVLLDRSGSMRGRRSQNALEAARGFVRRLRDGDRVTVLAYDAAITTLVPTTRIDATTRDRAIGQIRDTGTGGSTCISCALERAQRELERGGSALTHVLLLSDGQATSGERTEAGFRRLARRARDAGIGISSIGVDVDYNEALLASLAQLSNGRHHFVRDPRDLERAFERELEALSSPVATNAALEIVLAPGVELVEVLDREAERDGGRVRLRLGSFAAGDRKSVLARIRVSPAEQEPRTVADFAFDYDLAGSARQSVTGALGVRIASDESQRSSLDPTVAARIGASRTGAVLFDAGKLYKTGSDRDFAELERKLGAEIERVNRDRRAVSKSGSAAAARALDQQGTALTTARQKLRTSRIARCGCAPGDLMCAMRCAPRSQPEAELSDDEKAAAKDAVGASNPFKE